MNKWTKLTVLVAVVFAAVAALAFAASSVYADGPQGGYGRGGQGMGGMGFGGPEHSLVAIAAKTLGMEQADLVAQLQSGKTIADVAKDKSVTLDKIVAAFVEDHKALLQAAVTAGRLTQAQADTNLATMTTHASSMLSQPFTPQGRGMGMGFTDANNDGVCDNCGANGAMGTGRMSGTGNNMGNMGQGRGRWGK